MALVAHHGLRDAHLREGHPAVHAHQAVSEKEARQPRLSVETFPRHTQVLDGLEQRRQGAPLLLLLSHSEFHSFHVLEPIFALCHSNIRYTISLHVLLNLKYTPS